MARSSKSDPIEKFRFKVEVISVDLSLGSALESFANLIPAGSLGSLGDAARRGLLTITRAGFSDVALPRATISEISYRENIENQHFIKIPGLVKFEPITLRRGVTESKDLYNWYRLVNDVTLLSAAASELSRDTKIAPKQSETFRKEVIISALNRDGTVSKRWILVNAFPVAYKGGDDLSASSNDKLVEELTLTYEYFVEQTGDFAKELAKEAAEAAASAAIGYAKDKVDVLKKLF